MLNSIGFWSLRQGLKVPRFSTLERYREKHATKQLIERLRVDVLLDVGANIGAFAHSIRRSGYRGEIISFEPQPEAFARIKEKSAGDPQWRAIQTALGSEAGKLELNVIKSQGDKTVYSSFLQPKSIPGGAPPVTGQVSVPVQRLDALLPGLVTPRQRVFLKTDTQGYDMKVLEGAGEWLERVVGIQIELSVKALYEGMPHYLETIGYLESVGFSLMELRPIDHTDKGAILEYDGFMARVEEL